ncbi:MAG TPA: LysR family transcriptional regulator [Noviherbaspirillum sp.]|uniref:LysR family transcriptional regulator n=1 Tax=Noviherbaspirillum sp. TaxID=1926288 RepID=UPI002B49F779|nr:LysR family transcriptional regulator [Noviherbaspirillum sp.]HJV84560.1 LysR family transcriptional regulator [Noviherbaspirillum sp.]
MNPINLEIGDLEAVLAVAESGSFRAAAELLHLTQPSISARVQRAEDVLGVKLFSRTTRKVTITEHGKRLCTRADHTISELRSILREFKDEAQLKRGRVVVGATPTIAATVVPEVIRRFNRRWPGVEIILRDDFFGRALERLSEGEVDFAIVPGQKADSRFNFETLYMDELLLAAPVGHPLLKGKRVSLADVGKYPLLTMPQQSAIWGLIADAFSAEGLEFKPAFQTMHMMSLIAMIKADFGVGFLPRRIIPMLNMEDIGIARVGRSGIYREVCLATDRTRAIQPATEGLMMAFREGV